MYRGNGTISKSTAGTGTKKYRGTAPYSGHRCFFALNPMFKKKSILQDLTLLVFAPLGSK